jgi:hypothetical protein
LGYTHYYYRPLNLDRNTFQQFANDVKQIVKLAREHGIKIVDWHGTPGTRPTINRNQISLNGLGVNAHESFVINRKHQPESWDKPKANGLYFDFCKTARKPYDIVVAASLVAFLYHFRDQVEVHSDGGFDEDIWQAAFRHYEHATGRSRPRIEMKFEG